MLLEKLKTETRSQHQRLERSLDLLSPEWNLTAYRRLLCDWYAFFCEWQKRAELAADPSTLEMLQARRKGPLLERDLQFLGVDANTVSPCGPVLFLRTPADVLGSMYVLEGSTLGGQLLSRHFRKHLGISPEAGGSFFYSYGPETGSMWQGFRAHLMSTSLSEADERVIHAARLTFDFLEGWLCRMKR